MDARKEMKLAIYIYILPIVFLLVNCKKGDVVNQNSVQENKFKLTPQANLIVNKLLSKDIPWLLDRLPQEGSISIDYIGVMGDLTFDRKNFEKSKLYYELFRETPEEVYLERRWDRPISFQDAFKNAEKIVECLKDCPGVNLSTISAYCIEFKYQLQYFCDPKEPNTIDRCGIFGLNIDYLRPDEKSSYENKQ